MRQRNIFFKKERTNGAVDGRTDRSKHAKGAYAEGASWHLRKDLENFLTRPLVLPGNRKSLFSLQVWLLWLLLSTFSILPPLLDMEPQGSFCSIRKRAPLIKRGGWSILQEFTLFV